MGKAYLSFMIGPYCKLILHTFLLAQAI